MNWGVVWVAATVLQVDQLYPTDLGMSKEQYFLYSVLIKSTFLGEKELSAGRHRKSQYCGVSVSFI